MYEHSTASHMHMHTANSTAVGTGAATNTGTDTDTDSKTGTHTHTDIGTAADRISAHVHAQTFLCPLGARLCRGPAMRCARQLHNMATFCSLTCTHGLMGCMRQTTGGKRRWWWWWWRLVSECSMRW